MPHFELEEIEDYYTYFVLIMKIPESLFWSEDLRFLTRVVQNKAAYDGWLNYAIERSGERYGKK